MKNEKRSYTYIAKSISGTEQNSQTSEVSDQPFETPTSKIETRTQWDQPAT